MARYTRSLTVEVPLNSLQGVLIDALQACDFETLYRTDDYLIARETPGRVPFPKLVTVEVLIDNTHATADETRLNLVVKNEELPLQSDNHCAQMYDRVSQAMADNQHWRLVESVAGLEVL